MRSLPALALAASALLLAACGSAPACPSGTCGGGGSGGCPPVSLVGLAQPLTLAAGDGPALAMAVDADKIYWSSGASLLDRVAKTGGVITELGGAMLTESLVVDGDRLLVMSADGDLIAIPKDGSAQTTLVAGQAGAGFSDQSVLAVDDAHIYWVGAGPQQKGVTSSTGFVRLSDKNGQNVVDLATGRGFAQTILVDGGAVYWAEGGTTGSDGTLHKDGSVHRVPVAGGAVETLAGSLSAPRLLGRHGGVLWLSAGGDLLRLPEGGKPVTVFSGVFFATTSATSAFFVESLASSRTILFRAPLEGGCPMPLAEVPFPAVAPVLDDTQVFLAENNGVIASVPQ